MGKLRPEVLAKYVLSRTGRPDPAVIRGPALGEDAAAVELGDGRVLVAHTDPITGASRLLGWLAVNVPCNDVAVAGARPRWLLVTLYLPEGFSEAQLDEVTRQVDEAARELGVAVIGGHTEYTAGIDRPIASTTCIGITGRDQVIWTSGAREGDAILMTKTAGLEGTAILCTDFAQSLLERGVPGDVIGRGAQFVRMISVVKEALELAENRLATSMHDPTEGGVLGGLAEVAYASGKTLEVWESEIPVAPETRLCAEAMGLDVLRLISSGVLLATVPMERVDDALGLLRGAGVGAAVIGRVHGWSGHLVILHRSGGGVEVVDDVYVPDEVMGLWERGGG